uniref:Uncharacterized protein n=1 Tax=Timema poppense TaxID=170557 RepID=A0A7R9GYS8_TIMPO|nr:unnamed protein product [Timema poppensis]
MSFHSERKQCARAGMFVDKTSHTQTEKRGTFVSLEAAQKELMMLGPMQQQESLEQISKNFLKWKRKEKKEDFSSEERECFMCGHKSYIVSECKYMAWKLQTPAGTAFKAVQSRKIIVIKRNPNLTNISKIEGEVPVSSIRQVPMERELVNIESNVQLSKKMCMEDNQRKMKPFRPEWLRMEIFKDWLAPDPDNMCKARCIACNTALNAGKSELEKHAVGAKHTNNLDALKQSLVMQQMFTNANADDDDPEEYDDEDDDDDEDYDHFMNVGNAAGEDSNTGNGSAGRMFGGFASEKQMEVLTRIADSIDNLATITSAGFERLAQSQDSLNKTLADLLSK